MAEDREKTGDNKEQGAGESVWVNLLKEAGQKLVPIVVSTGSLLTFIAFAGAVIVWTRLSAVEIAADQAITAYPRSELVAVGSSLLLLFGFFGALAVLGAFLIDRGGRPTLGMARGLLGLVMVEGVTAILLVTGPTIQETAVALLLFLLPASFAIWIVSFERFSELNDELHSREGETKRPKRRKSVLRLVEYKTNQGSSTKKGKKRKKKTKKKAEGTDESCIWRWLTCKVTSHRKWLVKRLPVILAVLFTVALGLLVGFERGDDLMIWVVGAMSGVFWLLLLLNLTVDGRQVSMERKRDQREERKQAEKLAGEEDEVVEEFRDLSQEGIKQEPQRLALENRRLALKRPFRLVLNGLGMATIVPSLFVAAALPAWRLEEIWLGGALAAAAIIAMWLWRVAIFTRDRVVWFGLAVFLSVPLFGTLMTMARNLDEPQIQPVALIRDTDGPDEAIQGLYVTEADERVYFASVGMEGCTGKLRPNSGRLLWVPKDELVAMSVGPLQSVDAAAESSLEMAFALTPAVETPAGDSVSLTTGETRSERGGLGEESSLRVQRLENVGPAVRPTFGRGLELDPEDAQPGETVTLKMSTPIKDGFGTHRDGRSLRVGGTPAKVSINPVRDGERAEFVTTEDGRTVKLDEERRLYVKDDDGSGMVPLEHPSDRPETTRYVKVAEGEGVAPYVEDGEHPGVYLELEEYWTNDAEEDRGDDPPERVASDAELTLKEREFDEGEVAPVDPVGVNPVLGRQAWNEDEIKFELPEKASTGVVTVDCEQLAGQPLLRVPRPPEARIKARLLDSGKIALDSRRSGDDDRLVARRWTVNGRPRLRKEGRRRVKGAAIAVLPISRRLAMHRIRLTVEDTDGESDTATLHLLRIPRPSIAFDGRRRANGAGSKGEALPKRPGMIKRLRKAVVERAKQEVPIAVMVDAHARGERGPRRMTKSRKTARATIGRLLNPETAEDAGLEAGVPVITRAFGEGCAYVAPGSRKDRHVDVFILGEGVSLGKPRPCDPRHVERSEWRKRGGS